MGGQSADSIVEILDTRYNYKTPLTEKTGGNPLSRSSFYRILNDPFNYGRVIWNGEESLLDPSVARLMTEDEYWKIQAMLGDKGVRRPSVNFDVPYRGIIKCGECGATILPYPTDKKLISGEIRRHYYLRCIKRKPARDCTQPNMSLAELESQIKEILQTITISSDFYQWFIKWLKQDHQQNANQNEQLLKSVDTKIEAERNRINNLLELRIDGDVSSQEYKAKKKEIESGIKQLEKERENINLQSEDWTARAERRLNFAHDAVEKFENGTFEEKSRILKNLGTNFLLTNKKLTVDLDNVLYVIQKNQLAVNQTLERFKPDENLAPTVNKEGFNEVISQWLGDRDSNPNCLVQSQVSYH